MRPALCSYNYTTQVQGHGFLPATVCCLNMVLEHFPEPHRTQTPRRLQNSYQQTSGRTFLRTSTVQHIHIVFVFSLSMLLMKSQYSKCFYYIKISQIKVRTLRYIDQFSQMKTKNRVCVCLSLSHLYIFI